MMDNEGVLKPPRDEYYSMAHDAAKTLMPSFSSIQLLAFASVFGALIQGQAYVVWTVGGEVPKDGYYYRISYGFGQESILKWHRTKKWWVNFEGDRSDFESGNADGTFGLGNPEGWQLYGGPHG